jgi:hypothetical protein
VEELGLWEMDGDTMRKDGIVARVMGANVER